MGFIASQWGAMSAAYQAYRAYLNPGTDVVGAWQSRQSQIDFLWSLYQNSVFDRQGSSNVWAQYVNDHKLYVFIRSLYNPTRRLVNFYVGSVYPGVLAIDGQKLPDGVPLAIPISLPVEPTVSAAGEVQGLDLRGAIGAIWRNSNWQAGMRVQGRFAGATGVCLTEIVEEPERQKVCLANQWPGRVVDLDLNPQGDVQRYALQWRAERTLADGTKETFDYRKEVDKEQTIEYDGDKVTNVIDHGYGFCPAVWLKFRDEGSDFGSPAIAGVIGKIDELNSLMSQIHRHIEKVIESPQILSTTSTVSSAIDPEVREQMSEHERRVTMLKVDPPAGVFPLAGNLDLADALPYARQLLDEIEHDLPELTMYNQLREMSTVTGPAANRLLGDVGALVTEVAGNSDQQMIKAHQMAVAISGERYKLRQWQAPTGRKNPFEGFSLASYKAGDLDHEITPRPLITPTQAEKWAGEAQRATALGTYVNAGVPTEVAMPLLDFSPEEAAKITKESAEAVDRAQRLAKRDEIPTEDQ